MLDASFLPRQNSKKWLFFIERDAVFYRAHYRFLPVECQRFLSRPNEFFIERTLGKKCPNDPKNVQRNNSPQNRRSKRSQAVCGISES